MRTVLPFIALMLIAGCGPAFLPEATTSAVSTTNLVGTWQYQDIYRARPIQISFAETPAGSGSGVFTQIFALATGPSVTNTGTWTMSAPNVELTGVTVDIGDSRPTNINSTWWFMKSYRKPYPLVLFGGDCADPDHWDEMKKLSLTKGSTLSTEGAPSAEK